LISHQDTLKDERINQYIFASIKDVEIIIVFVELPGNKTAPVKAPLSYYSIVTK